MGILSTNKKIINLGQGYSAGNGISIDDYVISYTGNEGQLYNAGPNIDIYTDQDQLYISGKDWSADITNASSNAYEQATALIPPEFDPSYISGVVDNKLDTTAFSTVSGDYATTSYVDMSDDLTYSRATAWGNQNLAPLNSVADNSAKWNEIEVYEQNSATYLTAHQDISNKLDTTAFSTVSGNFLTAHQVIPSAKWEDASDVVQSNSAQWSENTGDEEVNNAVYNNSAKWNDISVYQTNSANYLTAHQDLSYISGQVDNKLDTTAFSNVSGTFLTAHQDISNKLDTTAFSTVSGTFLTAHQDLSNYATTGDLNTASGILSGAIDYLSGNAGKTYTGISPIVVNNDTNEISADSQDITFGEGLDFTNGVLTVTGGSESIDTIPVAIISPLVTGFSGESAYLGIESTALNLSSYVPVSAIGVNSYGYVSGISGMNISARIALTANYAYTADRAYHDRNYNEITSYYQPKLNIVGDAGTITAINGSAVGAQLPEGWELVAGQGIEIVDDSVNNQTTINVTAAGGNPEVESYVQTNSASIDDVVSTYEANSGNYLTAHQSLADYYTTADANTLSSMLSGAIDYVSANAGDEFPASANEAITAYQNASGTYLTAHQPISAEEWNSNYDTVNTNSGVWGGSALPISAGPGIKLEIVNNTLVASNDETVLWSGAINSTNTTGSISENPSNFSKLKIVCKLNATTNGAPQDFVFNVDGTNTTYDMLGGLTNSNSGCYIGLASVSITTTGISYTAGNQMQFGQTPTNNKNAEIYEVIGINRKNNA